eukprot:7239939-Ditylum_brightwellii.AAC.1
MENTTAEIVHLLNYAAAHLDAILLYHASSMVLCIHSDALFMSKPKAHSRVGGHYYLINHTNDPANTTEDEMPLNGLLHSICEIICNVMASTVEVEVGALLINARKGEEMRVELEEMGHLQPVTPIMTDNSTACG